MKNEILEFLNRHDGGKTAEIAEALAVTDYQARYYLLLLEKAGMVQRSPLRRGMATYWLLKGEKQAGQSCSLCKLCRPVVIRSVTGLAR
ncbi:pilus assembly protein [Escherichia coli]|uniref:Pilus assembly protein n=21 Tax=Enterobacterales TaxID=91347 RepID=A0A2X8XDS5_ECOLX|nr:PapI protein [Escherichia coli]AZZ01613.1 pilus assembly protein [Salmonella sp. SSDFZ54]EAN4159646.1 pilus assembly protein [Salmonella enterica]EAR6855769.1 pilus assembly protein [Salmonella enterica subsp. enterica serovar Uganda]EBG3523629.1 pilus assembly protein [Salmonella enterica subsp. enterica]EBG7190552.1 pilus assembly protein [Salmonella enterica subsp. enterica serovar Agona]EBH3519768.1 pilus assembly protein [Salmonella enterica subsp. enterica serovar Bredeney]ECA991072